MKKQILVFVISLFLFLAGCAKGNVSNVNCIIGDSVIFSTAEIESAMDTAIARFKSEFEGCTLLTMEYDEARTQEAALEWAEDCGAEEAIVLLSSFSVAEKGGDGSLNPGSTYYDWQWILVRSNDGAWELRTWGYG